MTLTREWDAVIVKGILTAEDSECDVKYDLRALLFRTIERQLDHAGSTIEVGNASKLLEATSLC